MTQYSTRLSSHILKGSVTQNRNLEARQPQRLCQETRKIPRQSSAKTKGYFSISPSIISKPRSLKRLDQKVWKIWNIDAWIMQSFQLIICTMAYFQALFILEMTSPNNRSRGGYWVQNNPCEKAIICLVTTLTGESGVPLR